MPLGGITTGATSNIWPEKGIKKAEKKYLVEARCKAVRLFGPNGSLKKTYKLKADPFLELAKPKKR